MKLNISIPASIDLEFDVNELDIEKEDYEYMLNDGIYNYDNQNSKLEEKVNAKLKEILEKYKFLSIDDILDSYSFITKKIGGGE